MTAQIAWLLFLIKVVPPAVQMLRGCTPPDRHGPLPLAEHLLLLGKCGGEGLLR